MAQVEEGSGGLVGVAEIAHDLLETTRQNAHNFTRRSDFPTPLARLRMGPVWSKADVELWIQKRKDAKSSDN